MRCGTEAKYHPEIIDLILAGADVLKRFTREMGAQLQGTDAGAPILVPTRQISRACSLPFVVHRRRKLRPRPRL